jgi:hypothetical protein
MREDEEHCKNAFDTFLKQRYQDGDITWTCGDRNKPPDYFLQLRFNKYAVEVTSVLEKATLGNKIIDHLEIDKSIKRFIEDIQKDAIEKGILKGAYIVRYKPIRDFGKQKQVIATRIRDYLRHTQNVSSAPAEDIAGKGHLRWYIHKLQSDKSYLSRTTEDAKWKGEAEDELCNLLSKALETKVKKLKTISLPKILLLHDRFTWIDADEWSQYLAKLSYVDDFHTIFLVSDKSSNSIVHSIESSWLNRF